MIYISAYITKKGLFDLEGAQRFLNRTLAEAEKELEAEDENLEKVTLIINFYYDISKIAPSVLPRLEAMIKKYMSINSGYEWLYFKLADVYMMKGNYDGAFEMIERAVSQNTMNDQKQFKLAVAAVLVSRDDIVKSALDVVRRIRQSEGDSEAYDKEVFLTEAEIYLIAQAYIKREDFLKALQYYKRLTRISPENASYHFDMAMLYLALNDNEKAIREARRASELDSFNYADKVDRFISAIKR